MKSTKGVAAAVVLLLAIPLAIASQALSEEAAGTVIHLAVGAGSVLLAAAMFDFALPRWVTWLGAASAGAFGTIFLLQGVALVVSNDALTYIAYDVLGQQLERWLPDGILVWFVALLLVASQGKTRWLGAAVVTIVVGLEVAGIIAALLGAEMPLQKVLYLLPIVWLLFESAKRSSSEPTGQPSRRHELVESPSH